MEHMLQLDFHQIDGVNIHIKRLKALSHIILS